MKKTIGYDKLFEMLSKGTKRRRKTTATCAKHGKVPSNSSFCPRRSREDIERPKQIIHERMPARSCVQGKKSTGVESEPCPTECRGERHEMMLNALRNIESNLTGHDCMMERVADSLRRAKAAIAAAEQAKAPLELPPGTEQEKCPDCAGTEFGLLVHSDDFPLTFRERCLSCGFLGPKYRVQVVSSDEVQIPTRKVRTK